MLSKAIINLLISLHIFIPGVTPKTPPSPTPAVNKQLIAPIKSLQGGVSIPDEVYADLALLHEINHVSVYYFDNTANNTVSIDSDKNWEPASTIKLYAAMYAFDQVSHGNISLNQNITIDAKNVAPSESYPTGYPPLNEGDSVSVYRLIDQMITQSDNTAFNTLLDLLDRTQITKYIHDLGLTNSSVGAKLNLNDSQQQNELSQAGYGPNLITANDYAKAFVIINGGRIPGSSDLFDILSRQKLNSMIPALLPKSVLVAHKTGELDPYYHDGGIIADKNRRYILSVFSDTGDPNIVAQISDLIYTTDINKVGVYAAPASTSEVPNAPLDPLVAEGKPQDMSNVLAASTQNIKLPKITASDLGIQATDLAGTLNAKQLPQVVVPSDSPLHVLVELGEALRVNLNPVPSLRTTFETENLKLNLAEANDLIAKGKTAEANKILTSVDGSLTKIAKESTVASTPSLQTAINQVSETRFSILSSEVAATQADDAKVALIKEVATQAKNATENVKPFIADAVKSTDLSQTPVIGQVVKSSPNSITVKTSDGTNVTTAVDNQVTTRQLGQDNLQVENVTQIPVGSVIALAGANAQSDMKPSFILTNISPETANAAPVTVLKVNQDTNTLVVASASGIPVQIDLTKATVIKGADTTISLDQVKPGDIVVVHGDPIPAATPSGITATASPIPAPVATSAASGPNSSSNNNPSSTSLPSATAIPGPTPTPVATTIPSASGKPATTLPIPTAVPVKTSTTSTSKPTAPTATPVPSKTATPAPQVIKGNVIQVVQTPVTPTTTPAPKSTPAPAPASQSQGGPTATPKK